MSFVFELSGYELSDLRGQKTEESNLVPETVSEMECDEFGPTVVRTTHFFQDYITCKWLVGKMAQLQFDIYVNKYCNVSCNTLNIVHRNTICRDVLNSSFRDILHQRQGLQLYCESNIVLKSIEAFIPLSPHFLLPCPQNVWRRRYT